ncbi:MAG: ferrochelatase [Betaproteobacteria bacterium]
MPALHKTSILLVNLGTPDAPTPEAVRRYLAEFLADPRVVELPRWLWLPLLHGIVLRTRPQKSAQKYAAIWTPEGSPLAVHTRRQAELLQQRLGKPVRYAMRYGRPPLSGGADLVIPLYPQYSGSATGSVLDAIGGGKAVRDFHDHPAYIAALAAVIERHWIACGRGGKLVMSFHGLPQRAVDRGDPYQKQCLATAELLARRLKRDYLVTFQSRFGAAKWLQPYTEPTLVELAKSGVKRVDVVCPGFVSDCLETLEEIGIAARHAFLAAGGEELSLAPCLNEAPEWIEALGQIAACAAP